MNRTVVFVLILLAAIALTVWVVFTTGPRYDPKNPNATPTPSQLNQ